METDRKAVQERFGLVDETMDYLEAYKYGADLLKKLAERDEAQGGSSLLIQIVWLLTSAR